MSTTTAWRHGGDHVVPIRQNCHDLKDRVYLRNWPTDLAAQAFLEAGPLRSTATRRTGG